MAVEENASAPSSPFVHLHCHSEYSLLDGLARIEDMVAEAKRLGMPALALTDHGVLYGALDFYLACRKAGIKPIIGVEAYVARRKHTDRDPADKSSFHLVLLAENETGYKNLLKLVTAAHLEGYYYKPRLDHDLLARHKQGLIALSACASGEVAEPIVRDDPRQGWEAAALYRDLFGPDHFFLEIQDHGLPFDAKINREVIKMARDLGLGLVATNDSHYLTRADAAVQEILLCIGTNTTIEDPKRLKMETDQLYFRSPQEMDELFREVPEAIRNTGLIAERCNLNLTFDRLQFPPLKFIPPGESPDDYLARVCREGLRERYQPLRQEVVDRLEYELSVVRKTGFAAYILFVWDFVRWAREHHILSQPRGSAAGSLILYCLGISKIDPIHYDLTFERFLNPERIQMPDVDMDFADTRRQEVIDYVVQTYGRERVAQIVTFGRLMARAAVRDVGRALAYPVAEVDRVAKLIPTVPVGITIDRALAENAELQQLYETQPHIRRLIDTARRIEGVARHASTHAAGVVVSAEPLVEHVPIQRAAKDDAITMTQYTMKGLEKIGLLKMDFLGLINLTILEKAIEYIHQTRGIRLDLDRLPLDDQKTFDLLSEGETTGVFQLESAGMRRYIRELRPNRVEDLMAMVALYRPGPMAHIPTYIAGKEGRQKIQYLHPKLEPILRSTYGVIVYQDQVLQIVRAIAGFSLGQADILRRAMGKKIPEEMKQQKENFLAGAARNGISEQVATQIWEYIEPFAGYAFNKAHAAVYGMVAYQTAYLKANYPAEYFAAMLTCQPDDTDKIIAVVGECRRVGIPVLPPHVNQSAAGFTVERVGGEGAEPRLGVRFGLTAVKGVGEAAVEKIVQERERGGPYRSLDDFCRRVDLKTVNKRVIECLIKAGALDGFGAREQLLAGVDAAMSAAQQAQRAAGLGQTMLFDLGGGEAEPLVGSTLPPVPPVTRRERLRWEKETLGLYLSEHPFQDAARALGRRLTANSSELTDELAGGKVAVAGVVVSVRRIFTKKKDAMISALLEDLHGSFEVVAFPRTYSQTADLWREDAILVVEGKVDVRRGEEKGPVQVICESVVEWSPDLATPGSPLPEPAGAAASAAFPGQSARANGHASPVEAPAAGRGETAVAAPAAVATPDSGDDAAEESAPARTLQIVLVGTGDDDADRALVRQVHALLTAQEGEDQFVLRVQTARGMVRLRPRPGARPFRTRYSVRLLRDLRSLLGEANVHLVADEVGRN